jgi:hypothetical protein
VPYYAHVANLVWSGLWAGLLFVAGLLVYLQFTVGQHAGNTAYAEQLTWVSSAVLAAQKTHARLQSVVSG